MAAIPNYGLLSTMADGLREGLIGYQTMANSKRQQQMADMMAQQQGFIKDDQGNYTLSPEASNMIQHKKQAEDLQYQQTLKQNDPAFLEQQRGLTKNYLNTVKPGLGEQLVTPDMDYNQLKDAEGRGDKLQSGLISKEMMGQLGLQKQVLANQGGGAMGARSAVSVSKDYELNTKPYRQTQEDVSRIESILNTKDKDGNPLITSQQLGDANAAMARIFSPGHMSDATVDRTEYQSMPAKFQAAIQKITANPRDSDSRALIEHIVDQAHHIANVSNENAMKEIDSLDSGYGDMQGPIGNIARKKSGFLHDRFKTHYSEAGDAAQQGAGLMSQGQGQQASFAPHPEDSAAVQWAKANPNNPKSALILRANGQ